MDFSEALKGIKAGHALFRLGWNASAIGRKLGVQLVDDDNFLQPYLALFYYGEPDHPRPQMWSASPEDLLADDWAIMQK